MANQVILESLARGLQLREQALSRQAAKEARAEELELRKQEQEARRKQEEHRIKLDEQAQKNFEAQQTAARKLQDAQMNQQEAAQALQFQQTGINPPGAQVLPGMTPTKEQPLVPTGSENNQLIFPSGNTYSAPPLDQSPVQKLVEHQRLMQENARIKEKMEDRASQYEAQSALRSQASADTRELRSQMHQDALEMQNDQQAFLAEQQRRQLAAQSAINDSRLATNLIVAGQKASGGLTGFGGTFSTDDEGNARFIPNDPEPIIKSSVDKVMHGQLTLEQAKKQFNVKAFPMINGAVTQQGLDFVTDKQTEKLRSLEKVSALVPKLYEIQKLRDQNWLALQNPLSDASKQFKSLQEQITGDLAGVSKWLNEVPRFTNVELKKVSEALIPSTSIWTSGSKQEVQKYYKFVNDIQDYFNSTLSNLKENQRNVIRQDLGFNKFPALGTAINTPGMEPGRIQGSTEPSQHVGGEQEKIKVKNKKTGQIGLLSPKFFDPAKYEFVQ